MKKIFAILMALCLLIGCAMAEEINWADIEGTVAESGIEGDFASISDIGLKMFIPSVSLILFSSSTFNASGTIPSGVLSNI